MTQYNNENVKLSNSQHNELKSATKNANEMNPKISLNMTDDSNDETNFRLTITTW